MPDRRDPGLSPRAGLGTRLVHPRMPELPGEPVVAPLVQTSGFRHTDPARMRAGFDGSEPAWTYSRLANPTTAMLADVLADAEGGASAIVSASGMAAISAVLLGLLRSGDHVVAGGSLYGGTSGLLAQLADRFGIEVSTVDTGRPGAISAAAGPATRLIYVETLSNPLVRVTDLPRAATEAHDAGTLLVVDNTFASPVLCRPIEHGADIVVHSLTKYIGGHSDLIAGAAVFADAEVGRRCADWQATEGAVADPFACWLTLRGIKTLPLRIRHAAASADAIARMAAAHPGVSTVHWPGLPGHPDHEIAARIASPPGAVLGIDVDGGMAAADRFQRAVRVAVLSGSLGGPETLVLHPATTSHRNATPEELRQAGIGAGTVRIAVGLEETADIVADIEQALDCAVAMVR